MRKVRFPKGEREIKKNATDLDRNAAIRLYPYGSAQGTRIVAMKRGPAEVGVWHHFNDGGQWKWERCA